MTNTSRTLRTVVLCVAAGYILLYLVVALARIGYPFELEWVEGSMVDHVQRVMTGQALYVEPSVDFVPAVYTPLYYYISAIVATFTGIGFLPLRLVSLLSSLGCMALLFFFVRRETGRPWAGLIAAGSLAATYNLSGAWLDLARVDSLYLFLLLAAIYVLHFAHNRSGNVLAGLLMTGAFLTKQTGLAAALFLVIYSMLRRKDYGWWFVLSFVASFGLVTTLLSVGSHGWFEFYVYEVSAEHSWIPGRVAGFWWSDLLASLPIACLAGAAFFVRQWKKPGHHDRLFFILMGAGMLLASWIPRVKDGNFANDVLPAYIFMALLFGIAVPVLLHDNEFFPHARWKKFFPALIWIALLSQFALLAYNPAKFIPSKMDRAAGQSFIASLCRYDGDVWVGNHGYYSVMAGKKSHASALAIYDILRAKNERVTNLLLDNIDAVLRHRRFAAIVVDNDRFVNLNNHQEEYVRKAAVFSDPTVFWTVSGARTRPLRVYLPLWLAAPGQEDVR